MQRSFRPAAVCQVLGCCLHYLQGWPCCTRACLARHSLTPLVPALCSTSSDLAVATRQRQACRRTPAGLLRWTPAASWWPRADMSAAWAASRWIPMPRWAVLACALRVVWWCQWLCCCVGRSRMLAAGRSKRPASRILQRPYACLQHQMRRCLTCAWARACWRLCLLRQGLPCCASTLASHPRCCWPQHRGPSRWPTPRACQVGRVVRELRAATFNEAHGFWTNRLMCWPVQVKRAAVCHVLLLPAG